MQIMRGVQIMQIRRTQLKPHDLVALGSGGEARFQALPEGGDDLLQPRGLDALRHVVRQVACRVRPLPLAAHRTHSTQHK